jgi:hypothetical protein
MITTDHLDSLKTRREKARRMGSQPSRSPVERELEAGRCNALSAGLGRQHLKTPPCALDPGKWRTRGWRSRFCDPLRAHTPLFGDHQEFFAYLADYERQSEMLLQTRSIRLAPDAKIVA